MTAVEHRNARAEAFRIWWQEACVQIAASTQRTSCRAIKRVHRSNNLTRPLRNQAGSLSCVAGMEYVPAVCVGFERQAECPRSGGGAWPPSYLPRSSRSPFPGPSWIRRPTPASITETMPLPCRFLPGTWRVYLRWNNRGSGQFG
jgi:hypothetical protein